MSTEPSSNHFRRKEQAAVRLERMAAGFQMRQELSEVGFAIDTLEQSRREAEQQIIFHSQSTGSSPSPGDRMADRNSPQAEKKDADASDLSKLQFWSITLARVERELLQYYELFDALVQHRQIEQNYFNQRLSALRDH
jgi:hypothetical protein